MNNVIENLAETFDIETIRGDFPLLKQKVHNKPIIYFDNAATTQKPANVLSAMTAYYQHDNANIHRGVHLLSVRATEAYENSRRIIQQFINAQREEEIIFVRGATEAINLVAHCLSKIHLKAGDEIILSEMEHHSNIVPWQIVCEQIGASIKVIPVTDIGELDLEKFNQLITEKTKLVAISHVSNAIGTINPIKNVIDTAHQYNIPVLIDGAQAVPHLNVDVQKLNCDFYVFSGHKMYGPTGIGVLYGKSEWLEKFPPYQGGGDMIVEVSFNKTTYNKLPHKLEAGTPNIAGVIGLGAAVQYLTVMDLDKIAMHENELLKYASMRLQEINGLKIIGTASHKAAVISFVFDNIHPHDIGTILDHEGIAIRAGHHCAMPLMTRYNLSATARISFGLYNTFDEVDQCVAALIKLRKFFG